MAMLYILDANVLIDANRDYYPMDRVPEFWAWLLHHASIGNVRVAFETLEEVRDGNDDLAEWASEEATSTALELKEEPVQAIVDEVIRSGYAADLTDDELIKLGRDPFLIAYAFAAKGERCVVTTEGSKPGRSRANRHIPDVCADLGIPCKHTFQFVKELDFRTSWRP